MQGNNVNWKKKKKNFNEEKRYVIKKKKKNFNKEKRYVIKKKKKNYFPLNGYRINN